MEPPRIRLSHLLVMKTRLTRDSCCCPSKSNGSLDWDRVSSASLDTGYGLQLAFLGGEPGVWVTSPAKHAPPRLLPCLHPPLYSVSAHFLVKAVRADERCNYVVKGLGGSPGHANLGVKVGS